jgi:DNA-binding beta-propeller fold protein YncE
VTNNGSDTVSAYAIGSGGLLTPLSAPTVATGRGPYGIAVTPNGSFLYVTNANGGAVSAYAIGSSGLLSPLSTPAFPTGVSPFEIAIVP